MLDTQTRILKNNIMTPTVRLFRVFTPTQLSTIGLIMIVFAGWFLVQQSYALALLFWILNRWFDGIDGIVARAEGTQTDLGGYIDIIFDFIAYATVPIALVYGAPSDMRWLALALLLGVFYVNAASWMYLAAVLEKRALGAEARGETTSITIPEGIVGGFVTIVFYCLFILLPQYTVILFGTMALLTALGVVQRLIWAARTL